MKIQSAANATGVRTVAFGAVLHKKLFASQDRIWLIFARILPLASFSRCLCNRLQHSAVISFVFTTPIRACL
jgi:hypothetical protein